MTKVRQLVNTAVTRELIKNTRPGSGWRLSSWPSKCPLHILAFLWRGLLLLQGSHSVLCQLKYCEAGTWALVFCAPGDFSYTNIYSDFTLWWHTRCWAAWKGGTPARRLNSEDMGIHLHSGGTAEWGAPTPRWTHWPPSHLLSPSCWRDQGGSSLPPLSLHHTLLFFSIWFTCSSLLLSSTTRHTMPERKCFRWQPTCCHLCQKGNIYFWKPLYSLGWRCPERKKYACECSWESWGLLPASMSGSLGKSILDKMHFNLSIACTVPCGSLFITKPFFFCFFC